MANHPIFFDASGRRAARIKVVTWVVGIAALVILVGFAASLVLAPPATGLNLPGGRMVTAPNLVKRAQKPGLLLRAERLAMAARKRRLDDIGQAADAPLPEGGF